jgi:adenosylcobinamide-phosphate guanylyltransferase
VAPAGINVVGRGPDETWVTTDERFAVNVNRRGDAAVAERLLVEG